MASTIRDVATFSGFSLGTISKYINGGVVKDKTRKKIDEAIKELNYKPNNIAKGLRNARSFTIGVLISKLYSNFWSVIITALEEYLSPLGYSIIVCGCQQDEKKEIDKINFFLHQMVDGIVILPHSLLGKQIEIIEQSKTPFVVIDQLIHQHKVDSVILDNVAAIEEPVEALIKMGHRDIAIITGDTSFYTAEKRLAGYIKAMNRHHIPIRKSYIRNGNYSIEGGFSETLYFFNQKKTPSALIVSNYDMTLGAVMAVLFLHKTIPENLSLIGFDDPPLTNVITPPLSVMRQPMVKMGQSAGELLFRRISGDFSDYPKLIVHKADMKLTNSVKQWMTK